MELLLWLWFYDRRWVLNVNISLSFYKNAWVIPLFLNIVILCASVYFLNFSSTFKCDGSIRLWLYSRTFFSFLISINIIFFMYQIEYSIQEMRQKFERCIKIYPDLKENIEKYDFIIKRRSLTSISGYFMFILGSISLLWSYLIFSYYYLQNYYTNCDVKIQQMLKIHSLFTLFGNFPLIMSILLFLIFKVGSASLSVICPELLISFSKWSTPEHRVIEVKDY